MTIEKFETFKEYSEYMQRKGRTRRFLDPEKFIKCGEECTYVDCHGWRLK